MNFDDKTDCVITSTMMKLERMPNGMPDLVFIGKKICIRDVQNIKIQRSGSEKTILYKRPQMKT